MAWLVRLFYFGDSQEDGAAAGEGDDDDLILAFWDNMSKRTKCWQSNIRI